MPRAPRKIVSGESYHVLNRAAPRVKLFGEEADYQDFVSALGKAAELYPVEVLAYCLMPDHWHLVLRPRKASALAEFMGWLGVTHVRRHQSRHGKRSGQLYHGRYKSFPVQAGPHLVDLCRFVESNPARKSLVKQSEKWNHSSLSDRGAKSPRVKITKLPTSMPRNWNKLVDQPLDKAVAERIKTSITRSRPLGEDAWTRSAASRHDLAHTLNPIGRPRKVVEEKPKKSGKKSKKRS